MPLQTLDDFIKEHQAKQRFSSNAYVRSPGFRSLYVRMGSRYINGTKHLCVLDIANVTAKKPGNGAFSKLVEDIHHRGITLYVENVLNERFAAKLLRMGFIRLGNNDEPLGIPSCFCLLALEDQKATLRGHINERMES